MPTFGGDTRINATFTASDKATPVIKNLRSNITALGSKTGGPLGGLLSGLGGLNLGMVGAVGVGVGFVGMLADATQAAIDEDKGIAQLTASLKANVPGWEAQTDAVDAAVASAEKLAFTDDAARESLSQLVTRTHDVGKATNLMREAMDLARLKGISLADASSIVGKVFSGQTSAARKAGIAISKTATSTEALAQIQKAAAGSAEAYANTTAGHYEQIQIKIQDLKEDIGHGLQPVIDEALTGITNLMEGGHSDLGPLAAALNKPLLQASGNANVAHDAIADVTNVVGELLPMILQMDQAILQGNGNQEMAALTWARYGKAIGVNTMQLKDYIISALAQGMTYDQIEAKLKALAATTSRHNRMLEQQAANTKDAATSTNRHTAALDRYKARLDAIASAPGANLDLLVLPKKQSIERQAESIGKAYPDGIAAGMESNIKEVAAASRRLNYAIKYPLAILHQKGGFMWAAGKLGAEKLVDGLQSKNPAIRAEAHHKAEILRGILRDMPSYAWGSKVAADYLAGLRAEGLLQSPFGWGVKFNTGIHSDWEWHIPTNSGGGGGGGGKGHNGRGGGQGGGRSGFSTQSGTTEIHTHVHLDGKEIARTVDRHFGMGWSVGGTSSTRS